MIEFTIPGRGRMRIKNIVFDVNGTIAIDGKIDEKIKKKLEKLAQKVTVILLTADTYGTIEKEM
ncbi:hypothetical protein KAX75_03115, partial [candidate division WOR-3 bacterium]|nr:hypothetical protein [candidate division WOR-3 bacterium]